MSVIKFGTSGWRGIISDTFTFANVEIAAHAIAQTLVQNPPPGAAKRLIIGHDTRFLSREFATRCAEIVAGYGFEAWLTDRDTPTPVIAHAIRLHEASGGINITASHNPPEYNGLKFNEANGAPASPEICRAIERKAEELGSGQKSAVSSQKGNYQVFNPMPEYLAQLRKLVDFRALRQHPKKAVVDLMYGTGRGYLDMLLAKQGWKVDALHGELNPLFGAGHPEPTKENMGELLARLKKSKAAIGLGLDPDADRYAAVDSDGTFINPNQVLAVLLYHLVKNRKWTGAVVRTVATSHFVDAVAARYGVPVRETPVGFKYIGAVMEQEPVIVGGEESGGYGFRGHIPERDGILASLYFLDLMIKLKKTPSQLVSYLYEKVGPHYYDRIDIIFPEEQRKAVTDRVTGSQPKKITNLKVKSMDRVDGFRYHLTDGSWLLIRFSGTEPLLRIYAEAPGMDQVRKMLEEGRKIAGV